MLSIEPAIGLFHLHPDFGPHPRFTARMQSSVTSLSASANPSGTPGAVTGSPLTIAAATASLGGKDPGDKVSFSKEAVGGVDGGIEGGVGVFQRIGSGQFEGAVEGAQAAFPFREPTPNDALASGNSLSAREFSRTLARRLGVEFTSGGKSNRDCGKEKENA